MTINLTTSELNDRVESLEIKLSYQEDTINTLNQIVAKQDQLISELREQQKLIIEKLKGLQATSSNIHTGEEIPPHY